MGRVTSLAAIFFAIECAAIIAATIPDTSGRSAIFFGLANTVSTRGAELHRFFLTIIRAALLTGCRHLAIRNTSAVHTIIIIFAIHDGAEIHYRRVRVFTL